MHKMTLTILTAALMSAAACKTTSESASTAGEPAANATQELAVASEPDTPSTQLDPTSPEHLLFMLEEEKLARDVHNALGERWEHRTFTNIPRSEGRHMDAVSGLLKARGLPTDAASLPPGEFENEALQTMYVKLVARGQSSRLAAYEVGALIEETDIRDLDAGLAADPPEDISRVYTNLRRASYNHLDGFVSAIESEGGTYTPGVLTPGRYEDARAQGAAHHEKRGKGHGKKGQGEGTDQESCEGHED